MPKFVRIQQKNPAEVAGQVAAGLARGPAVVPVLGGHCVLGRDRVCLARFGSPYRLVTADVLDTELAGLEQPFRERARKAMAGPLVAEFGPGRSGVALAVEPLAREIVSCAGGEVWLGVPEEETGPEELVRELGKEASVVVSGGAGGPGPTVVDFGARPAVVDRRGKLAILDLERELGELVLLGPGLYFSVLVVCTGNSCRSPMARAMLVNMLEGTPALVSSAGTAAPVGSPATAQAVEAMNEVGLDLTRHRAQQLVTGMVRVADLVLVMEDYHRQQVLGLAPDAAGRTRLLLSFAGKDERVEDPVGFPIEVYRLTRGVMKPALERVAAEVRKRAGRKESPEPTT